jgi:hypothetical protein
LAPLGEMIAFDFFTFHDLKGNKTVVDIWGTYLKIYLFLSD